MNCKYCGNEITNFACYCEQYKNHVFQQQKDWEDSLVAAQQFLTKHGFVVDKCSYYIDITKVMEWMRKEGYE